MMETVNMMQRSFERQLSYGNKKANGKLKLNDGDLARVKTSDPYIVSDGLIITIDERAHATDVDLRRGSMAIFAPLSAKIFKVRTIKYF